jgi:hypothetical protein
MLSLPPPYAQALRDLPDTSDNPFYWRERRRDERRKDPWKTLLQSTLVLGIVFMLALAGQWTLLVFSAQFPDWLERGRIPVWLGGPDGGRVTFALLAAFHALQIGYAARGQINGILEQEARGGTLYQVLMTRIPAFQILLQMTVYPFQRAMLVALAGLPFYSLLISYGSVTPYEVFVLYVIFSVLSIPAPGWRTPAFQEATPEEIGQTLTRQSQNAGCLNLVLSTLFIPAGIILGSILYGLHTAAPDYFSRIPPEVFPALVAFPLTFAWVIVKVLTAPYTWFGLPLPLWVWLAPALVLGKIGALWTSSQYLRIAEYYQIAMLPDQPARIRWRNDVSKVVALSFLGYLWQPLLETNLFGRLFAAASPITLTHNLTGALFLIGGGCLFASLFRARRYALMPTADRPPFRTAIRTILRPFLLLQLALVVSLLGMWRETLSLTMGAMLLKLAAVSAGTLLLALSLGPGSQWVWWLTAILAPLAGFLPQGQGAEAAALNPLTALLTVSSALERASAAPDPVYHLPLWWSAALIQAGSAGVFTLLWRLPWLKRLDRPRERQPISLKPRAKAVPPVYPVFYGVPSPGSPTAPQPQTAAPLRSDTPAEALPNTTGTPESPAVSAESLRIDPSVPLAPAGAVPPVVYQPYPPYPPQGSCGYAAPHPIWKPLSEALAWRWRPLSPLAAFLLRWLVRRTDNPVALYSARRVLPGSLNSDMLFLSVLALVVGFFACLYPPLFYTTVFAPFLADLLYNHRIADDALGPAYLVAGMVGYSFLTSLRACGLAANSFRKERQLQTLGFLLTTPLSSRSVAYGQCVGAFLPAFALWLLTALCALIPTSILAYLDRPGIAFWGWALGFSMSLLYLLMGIACGAWIGLTEEKVRDVTFGLSLMPAAFYLCGVGAAYLFYQYVRSSYPLAILIGFAVNYGLLVFLWQSVLRALQRMRRGDIPFESFAGKR